MPVGLDRERAHAALALHPAEQPKRLDEAGADDDPLGRDAHAADAREVSGERLAQLCAPARVAVAERVVGRRGERSAGGASQAVRGNRAGRAARTQVVARRARRRGPLRKPPGAWRRDRQRSCPSPAAPRATPRRPAGRRHRRRCSGRCRGRAPGRVTTATASGPELPAWIASRSAHSRRPGARPRPSRRSRPSQRWPMFPSPRLDHNQRANLGPRLAPMNTTYRHHEIPVRLDFDTVTPPTFSAALSPPRPGRDQAARQGRFDPPLRELVRIRASQLNGCAYCIDMHTKDARAIGETEQRIYALPAWRETAVLHRPRAGGARVHRVRHPARTEPRPGRGLRGGRRPLRRGRDRRPDQPDRHHQRLEPAQRRAPRLGPGLVRTVSRRWG